jgi:hypothetical protein
MNEHWERLLYVVHRDGRRELDFGWLILAVCCVVGLTCFILSGFGLFKAPVWAWSWFGAFTTMAFIAGAAISRARLIAKSDAPGQVAQAIASAGAEFVDHETMVDREYEAVHD